MFLVVVEIISKLNVRNAINEYSSEAENELWLQCVLGGNKSKVTATMVVNECDVRFQIDIGAEINTITRKFVK